MMVMHDGGDDDGDADDDDDDDDDAADDDDDVDDGVVVMVMMPLPPLHVTCALLVRSLSQSLGVLLFSATRRHWREA